MSPASNDASSTEVRHDADQGRYAVLVDGQVAGFTEARVDGDVVVLPHTEIDEAFEGRGLASTLVRFALDDLRSQGKKVDPQCSYIKKYIAKHDEYADLVV